MNTPKTTTPEAWKQRCLERGLIAAVNPVRYEGYLIFHSSIPYGGKFVFEHENFDGPGDRRCGDGDTIEECIDFINDQILEHP